MLLVVWWNLNQLPTFWGSELPELLWRERTRPVSICLECNSSKLRGLKRKWIRCSAQATVLHLKKFIAKKLNLTSFNEKVHVHVHLHIHVSTPTPTCPPPPPPPPSAPAS
ncbi:RING finger protein 3 [Takifugu flavidus]|uniref:RING finger protein 3 n=1 Tax=Takifugu flavidus TaxID=433684 RepID=A0A5C6MJQ4_9TELE|nr:RING finger protein 3 [Takifugu flavidus]